METVSGIVESVKHPTGKGFFSFVDLCSLYVSVRTVGDPCH